MKQQLTLLDTPPSWRIDERTKEIGRRGLAQARAALRGHTPPTSAVPATTENVPRAA